MSAWALRKAALRCRRSPPSFLEHVSLRASFRNPRRREFDRFDDSAIAAAAAEVSVHGLTDLGVGRTWVFCEQRDAAHDHARCAVCTLKRSYLEQRLLQRVEAAIAFQCLD